MTTFSELPIPATLAREIAARGYTEATAVQAAAVDESHAGRDLLVSSKTGSGKTVAFGLAVADLLLDDKGKAGKPRLPRALVVAPTRELAQQVARELSWLYRSAGGVVATCVGGMDPRREARALAEGAHFVVGTPGRLCDHLERGALSLEDCRAVILDEADEMLDMGFKDELERILDAAPAERRTLLFSATLPDDIKRLARRYTKDPVRIEATAAQEPHADIEHIVHLVAPRERDHAVVNVLRLHDAPSALVFGATREGVAHLCAGLVERGFSAVALSGELSQAERNRALQGMRDGRARVLVATDVAARGLDLPAVSLVVHADLPNDASVLRHRSGRTGRAGKKGVAVVLVPFPRRRLAERLLAGAGVRVRPTPPPTADEVRALDAERLRARLQEEVSELEAEDIEQGRALVGEIPPEKIAGLLVRLERRALPAPEELPLTAGFREAPSGAREARGRGRSRDGDEGEGAWFRVNVGRDKNADPRWLLPLLCRRGGISKRDIGRIVVLARETRFEVNPEVARDFAREARKPDQKDPNVRIAPMEAAPRRR